MQEVGIRYPQMSFSSVPIRGGCFVGDGTGLHLWRLAHAERWFAT